ncbi:MAG: conjugal transfer protein TraR [Clostridiales bacterium]|nr:conjugal transfer protein TraR [Clostridiales bacterium]
MKDYEIRYLKNRLLDLKKETQDRLEVDQEYIRESNIKDDLGELSPYDNHPADIATELFEKEMRYSLENHSSQYLKDIENSLEKIVNGEYGICDFCKREIDIERLKAYPTARFCIDCQQKETVDGRRPGDRPIEEEALSYPFGRTFTDDGDSVIYDGEDAWQDVGIYGSSSGPQDISVNRLIDYKNDYYGSEERVGTVEDIESIGNKTYEKQIAGEDKPEENDR